MRGELRGEGDPKDHTDVCPSTLHLALGRDRGVGSGICEWKSDHTLPYLKSPCLMASCCPSKKMQP